MGTAMRNVFVGALSVIGSFLLTYRGYERKDDLAGDLCFVFALGVALFPSTNHRLWVQAVHHVSAAGGPSVYRGSSRGRPC